VTTTNAQTLQPQGWPRPKGYANGIAARGRFVFVAGQVGWDANERIVSEHFVDQARQALQNIVAVLREADATPECIVRLTWYVVDKREYLTHAAELGRVYRSVIGAHYPAMSAVEVKGLVEEGARVEIEATAVVPDGRS
jgi:enamine deaminase RidA (YjgF/YER057c/UK114 family)